MKKYTTKELRSILGVPFIGYKGTDTWELSPRSDGLIHFFSGYAEKEFCINPKNNRLVRTLPFSPTSFIRHFK